MKSNPWKLTSIVLMAALIAAAVSAVASSRVATHEPQPFMRAARGSLVRAKASLEKATPDKGGHRVAALKLVSDAIDEVDKGIHFDDKH